MQKYINKENFIACREEEGIQLIKEMKKRFSATVTTVGKSLIKNMDVNLTIELVSQIIYSTRLYNILSFIFTYKSYE